MILDSLRTTTNIQRVQELAQFTSVFGQDSYKPQVLRLGPKGGLYKGGLPESMIGAAIPLPHAVSRLSPLCFPLSLSASIQPGLCTPLTRNNTGSLIGFGTMTPYGGELKSKSTLPHMDSLCSTKF
jgi:hypothetical protein